MKAMLPGTCSLLLALVSCARDHGQPAHVPQPPIIDLGIHRIGDSLGPFRITGIDARPEIVDDSGWSGRVDFSGVATVSGSYRPHHEYPEARALCFFPDSASAATLPRFPNDPRYSWFCFSNHDVAERILGAPDAVGEATIEIEQYRYLYEHTDTYNTAQLRRVVARPQGGA
jgi:hypothetical protein